MEDESFEIPTASNIWVPRINTTASHIFSYKHGQETMNAIFGSIEEPVIFHPRNGLIVFNHIEESFDSGFFVIVPWLPETPASEDIRSTPFPSY